MQEDERVPHLLDRLDLARFQLKEYRNFDDCEYRAPSQTSKTTGKAYEVIYNHTFNQDLLITHIDIEFNHKEAYSQLFEVGEIEASKITNRGMFGSVIRSKIPLNSREDKGLVVSCISITQSLKVSLLLKKEFTILYNDSLSLKKEKSKQASEQNVLKMISHAIKAVSICGFHLSIGTAASELVPLLNISQAFKHSNRFQEAAETDILVSLSLISARRFVQAAESLRTASKFYVEKYISSKSSMDIARIDKSWLKQDNKQQLQLSAFSRTFCSGRVLQGGRYLYKAAKIELLLADTINQPTLLGEKLEAYNRASCFANGNVSPSKLQTRIDYEEVAYNIGPAIMPFLLKVLSDKAQIYKISALKSIQFFYDTLGCTLANFMPSILKSLITAYPTLKEREQSATKAEEGFGSGPLASGRSKLLLDHINHLLESLLSLLTGVNKKCLKMMFEEIIQVSLSEEYRNELRLYLLRFGERIMQICGSDLDPTVSFIRYLFAVAEGKYTIKADVNKHINHNLIFFSQRAIDLLKSKILRHFNRPGPLTAIANWINATLISLCENENISSQSHLNHALDLVIAIYSSPKLPLAAPFEPIIYLLNTSLNEPKLPFEKILQAFVVLVGNEGRHENGEQLASQIIERVLGRSKICTLGLKELKILQRLLEAVRGVKTWWLRQFLECIPHSNYDEIYTIFDLLVGKCVRQVDKDLISRIISTLFNQYTVKGKAHQQSKELFISRILQELPGSLTLLLQICLFENKQPQIANYSAGRAEGTEHRFDSKQFKLHSELFGEKISLLLQVVSKKELLGNRLKQEGSNKLIYQLYESSDEVLNRSINFKVKSKFLSLLKHFILLMGQLPDEDPFLQYKVLFCRTQLDVLKKLTNHYKDSKIQYYALLNIGLLLQQLMQIKAHPIDPTSPPFPSLLDQDLSPAFKLTLPLQSSLTNVAYNELSKMWSSLVGLLNSPLEQVRETLMVVLLNSFKGGLGDVAEHVRDRIMDQVKPLMSSTLHSKDYSQRLVGVRLLAVLIGLGKQYQDYSQLREDVYSQLRPLLHCLDAVVALEDDWNEEISSCSRLISQICVSKTYRARLLKRLREGRKNSAYLDASNVSFNLQEETIIEKKSLSMEVLNNLDLILKIDDQFASEAAFEMPAFRTELISELADFRAKLDKVNLSNLDNAGERESFAEEQQYFDPNEERHSDKEKQISSASEEEQLQFEDLGIIELDDEEWGEEQNEVKITQKLPLKKVYKLSPNLGSSSKHHRLRNKRLVPAYFEEEKIIIDELEGRISYPPVQASSMQPRETLERLQKRTQLQDVQGRIGVAEDFMVSEGRGSSKKDKKGTKKRKVSSTK